MLPFSSLARVRGHNALLHASWHSLVLVTEAKVTNSAALAAKEYFRHIHRCHMLNTTVCNGHVLTSGKELCSLNLPPQL
jgi:hypothetical protein